MTHTSAPMNRDFVSFIEKAAELERATGALYAVFAEMLPAHGQAWKELADEEEEHAMWLLGFEDLVETGTARPSYVSSSMSELAEGLKFIESKRKQARTGAATQAWAVETARLIETSILERDYARVLLGATQPVRELLERVRQAAAEHIRRIDGMPRA